MDVRKKVPTGGIMTRDKTTETSTHRKRIRRERANQGWMRTHKCDPTHTTTISAIPR